VKLTKAEEELARKLARLDVERRVEVEMRASSMVLIRYERSKRQTR